ncbi:MAG: 2-oxoglutarate dehydrogenase E1 component [Flavobacteriales bacterium]|nr:2-oxoglutarate dehydrogenase E1 component [Flavobacteriales bacterium]MCB9195782.1 2-oxoglutarate dehydrogenase E1 component [Flavobacteriales bacterium]
MDKFSYMSNGDVNAIEELYNQYLADVNSVDEGWRTFFEGFEFARKNFDLEAGGAIPENVQKEFRVINLINGYRSRGHLFTHTNPVRERRKYTPTLEIENFGLENSDLNVVFQAGNEVGIGPATLKEIIDHLEETYCQSIGIEYMYIREPQRVDWIRNKIELKNRPILSKEAKKHVLHKLNQASVFEQFLHKKFVGQKRFSLEGGEAIIPALDAVIERAADHGVKEFVMGMAHRGRLNVLANIFNKTYAAIFSEFEGKEYEDTLFDGDVKYHLGYSVEAKTDGGKSIKMTLAPNPSHLETVNPVVEGISRSKIDHKLNGNEKEIVPILIHGDAAIAGQGIVYEVVQMAQLDGYRTGGTIHIVINNQVGFTTNYLDARSSTYCTDVAKTTLCPVFHVNGDDVEAVVQTMQIALEYRQEFGRDVFVDLLCYRKYGHNEGDEPKFTQPKLYKLIAKHPSPREIYLNQLVSEGVISTAEGENMEKVFDDMLQERLEEAKQIEKAKITDFLAELWQGFRPAKEADFDQSPETGVDKKVLLELAEKITRLPEGKNYFRKIEKLFHDRRAMVEGDNLDWGMGELLAYASLLNEGHPVRLSGQDVERGTFSHRHAVVKTEDTEEEVIPLNLISDKQAKLDIYNSLLSEYGVLGFDYGYAFATPNGLTIWEAQFGDFNNGAQIMMDQYISAAEDKWHTQNGIVLLLPHGYEGQGSEHSSGRMERFLQLCGDLNWQITNCTTPANFFHLLRRQLKRDFRKPLVVFTPKKLLRYPKAVSTMDELANGRFQEVIDDTSVNVANVDTVILCTGKFYYDILERKEETGAGDNIAVVRVEQLYPVPQKQLDAIVAKYGADKKYIWAQEEPENMGAWSHMLRKYRTVHLDVLSRRESASPAAGSPKVHANRHNAILDAIMSHSKEKVS